MNKRNFLQMLRPMMQADGGGGNGGAGAGGAGADGGEPAGGQGGDVGAQGGSGGGAPQGMTPEQVAAQIAEARKQWEADEKAKREKEQMTEAERLKAEKEEAENKARVETEKANARVIRAEAKVQAAALGVAPEKLEFVLKLAELNGIKVNENGDPDEKAIKTAVEAVLTAVPEFKGSAAGGDAVGGGTNPGGGGGVSSTERARQLAEERNQGQQKQTSTTGFDPWA